MPSLPPQPPQAAKPGDQTRLALALAGIRLFGAKGFEATSTREIAAAANANIASIAYHFGGKDGLRLACADLVVSNLEAITGPMLAAAEAVKDPGSAQEALERTIMAVIDFLLGRPEARDIAAFMIREVGEQGVVMDKVYRAFIEPAHARLCRLLGRATGLDPASDRIRLGVFSIVGQVVYFRIGLAVVARGMEWDRMGPEEIARIKETIVANIRNFIAANRTQP
ncbi:CerR family C-terminal domain-containing protein [Hoeflea olei]|uniref:HTH tetR-type domain-containing protein n=1 Tax=Hoeflea olei TaxID=1480615 RepID=A0A1C1YW64_9HYPH|nr:CerR family C-terminal domain-containing protein [Hoeflea olei]OCW57793.1 hypothetical protein AWJ14_03075 [Hoeflea olei]